MDLNLDEKEWYLQKQLTKKILDHFGIVMFYHMCEVLETTDKKPFGMPIKDFKKKKDRKYFLDEAEKLINGPRAKRVWAC